MNRVVVTFTSAVVVPCKKCSLLVKVLCRNTETPFLGVPLSSKDLNNLCYCEFVNKIY